MKIKERQRTHLLITMTKGTGVFPHAGEREFEEEEFNRNSPVVIALNKLSTVPPIKL